MIEPLVFSVTGTPRPKSRPRKVRGRWVSTAGAKEKLWRDAVERAARVMAANAGLTAPIAGAVRVKMVFTFVPPPSAPDRIGTPHTHKPDKDNLEKLVLDAIEAAGVIGNDSQVAQGPTEKWWGARPGVAVRIEPIGAVRRDPPALGSSEPPAWLRA